MLRAGSTLVIALIACGGPRPVPPGDLADDNPSAPGERPWPVRQVEGYDPREAIELVTIAQHPWRGDDFGSGHYRDVMSHARPETRFGGAHRMSTLGHETHHGLLAQVMNERNSEAQFFYFERGFGAFVDNSESWLEPVRHADDGTRVVRRVHRTSIAEIRDYVPETARRLAASRYRTYLLDDTNDHGGVLHLMDEWNAYLAGGRMSIEAHRAGQFPRATGQEVLPGATVRIDAVDGMVDFLWFVTAAVVALSEREPDYLAGNRQLKAVYGLFAEETVRLFAEGRTIASFRGFHGEALFDAFATAADNQRARRVLRQWLGRAWTRRVFGF